MTDKCKWSKDPYDGFDDNNWSSSCGFEFAIFNGAPCEDDIRFCCYCGKEIEVVPYQPEKE